MSGLSRSKFAPELLLWRDRWDFDLPDDLPLHYVCKERAWHTPRAILGISRLIDELRPDVLFTQLHYVNLVTGTALRLCRHRPTWICRFSGDPRSELKGVFATWARRVIPRAASVVACSAGVSGALREHLNLPPERVEVIPNLLDLERVKELSRLDPIDRRRDCFVLLHVGRLDEVKNHQLLFEAFSRLRNPNARLWIVGQGPLQARLEAQARSLGIADRITWLGFQPNPYRVMKAADCLALTGLYEGFPNVIIESMACGTPTISTRTPYGPDEIIEHERTGMLVEYGSGSARAVHRSYGVGRDDAANARKERPPVGELLIRPEFRCRALRTALHRGSSGLGT